MDTIKAQVFPYRWVVLGAYMFINMTIQIQWLTFAPIRSAAIVYYNVSGPWIDFLSMSYMLVFLVLSIPASYIIDTYGIRTGLGIGAVVAGVSSLLKGVFADSFTLVVIGQIGLAVAQPFILNAVTPLSRRWFPLRERAMAAGFGALSIYIGIIIVMICTPFMIHVDYNGTAIAGVSGISRMLFIYGIITLFSAVLSLIFIREKPPVPPEIETVTRHSFVKGMVHLFKQRNMIILIIIFFLGLGMFNAVSTMIDSICLGKGLNIEQSGLIGGLMLIGGVIGAVIIPVLSDKMRKRKIFLVICMIGMIPGVIGLHLSTGYTGALISSFILGFFIMSAGPIGFQYAAEVSFPTPESTSQGIILLAGQISGLIFVAGMGTQTGLNIFMYLFIAFSFLALIGALMLGESPMILAPSSD